MFLLTLFLLQIHFPCYAQPPALPGSEGSPFGSYLNMETPLIGKVSHSPEVPKPGEEVTFQAEVYNDPKKTDDVTETVYLHYSMDEGKTWDSFKMDQDGKNEKLWITKLMFKEEKQIIYYISAKDSAENVASELPMVEGNTVFAEVKDENDSDSQVEPDLDIVSAGVSYDSDRLYLRIKVQGEVRDGTVSPPYMHNYTAIFGEDLPASGWTMLFAPLLKESARGILPCLDDATLFSPTEVKENKKVSYKKQKKKLKIKLVTPFSRKKIQTSIGKRETIAIVGGVVLGFTLFIYWLGEAMEGMLEGFFQMFIGWALDCNRKVRLANITHSVEKDTLHISFLKNVVGERENLKFIILSSATTCSYFSSKLEDLFSCILPKDASKYLNLYFRSHKVAVSE